ncbi:SET domain-containing protein-lysine N-methyltransferase [Paraburkholderia sp.]|uniref:SET domain-containing protein n=1 Tax=Paraburkholderia sp. TaxID=1926495 RepID=UPI00238DD7E8|nr:SET domain-containing protein-lysine N-methyltransferase [Paraburkholderia sp.]MDE1180753.1 SET domain-containing protein-lysine N-methyltransferase [Paraburkholderia sp.]
MRRITVRRSPVHGKGVFALRPISKGERIFEYKGELTSWREASRRYRRYGQAGHTFYFALSDGRVIDGGRGGNSARWLNHACAANCEAIEEDGRIFIDAVANIETGDELFISYGLVVDEPVTDEIREQYACRCGARACSRSMLGANADGEAVDTEALEASTA